MSTRGFMVAATIGPVLAFAVLAGEARGHASGENYVWLNVAESHLEGHFEINFVDLTGKLGIEINADDPAESVRATAQKVQQYIREHFRIIANGEELPYEFAETDVFGEPAVYAQYYYRTKELTVPDAVTIQNDLLFEGDFLHRSLIVMEFNQKAGQEYGEEFATMVFSPTSTEQELDLLNVRGLLSWREFIWQGVLHIWIGYDHILFLVALLLPAVLTHENGQWTPLPSFGRALWNILKIVTVFTVAHSITLALAALHIVEVPSRLVESVIALSIVLVGLNTIVSKFDRGSLLLIFFFGLFHGLGFASVMGELPFRIVNLTQVILSFNVGVELGQVAIVAAIFPVIFLARGTRDYVPIVLRGGTLLIVLVAAYWFAQRAFGL